MSFTNLQVKWIPLRADDPDKFQRFRNRMLHIDYEKIEKRRRVIERYRERRTDLLNSKFRKNQFEEGQTTSIF